MELILFPLAVLFMLMLVFNAAFNLFCGLCAAAIVWRDLSTKSQLFQTTIKPGAYHAVEDSHGIKHIVTDEELKQTKERDKEFEQWLMMN